MWKVFSTYDIFTDAGEEKIFLENEDDKFRLRNEFGNMSFEFNLTSGAEFAQMFVEDMKSIVEEEVMNFVKSESSNDSSSTLSAEDQDNDFGAG